MEIIYGKANIKNSLFCQIVELFAVNYSMYHYKLFQSQKGIIELFNNERFDCLIIMDGYKVIGFAGYYIKSKPQDSIMAISMAHLLVDNRVRGMGVGTLLEESRQKMIKNFECDKIIYASCVEKPSNSIQMKLNRGFYVGGFRYKYRPGKNISENAVVMVNKENLFHNLCVEKPCIMTQKILIKGNPNIKFRQGGVKTNYKVRIQKDELLGREIYYILDTYDGEEMINQNFIKKMNLCANYTGAYLSPSIIGFSYIDKILTGNLFYPMCYIPFINDGAGIIEYQYIEKGISSLLKKESVSPIAKDFLFGL